VVLRALRVCLRSSRSFHSINNEAKPLKWKLYALLSLLSDLWNISDITELFYFLDKLVVTLHIVCFFCIMQNCVSFIFCLIRYHLNIRGNNLGVLQVNTETMLVAR
jgi:hypothetical protein